MAIAKSRLERDATREVNVPYIQRSAAKKTGASSSWSGTLRLVVSWLVVGIPLGWGIYATALKAIQLFR
jgi:hypothetical protein